MVDTPSMAAPGIKIIGASCSHNTSNTSSRKECEKYCADKPVHDEVDYAIASHHKSMFLVQFHIFQEDGQTMLKTLSTTYLSLKRLAPRAYRILSIHPLEKNPKIMSPTSQSMKR